ncbi:MAG: hypothetical protein AABO41_26090 [Acidobacteriota bacterium]
MRQTDSLNQDGPKRKRLLGHRRIQIGLALGLGLIVSGSIVALVSRPGNEPLVATTSKETAASQPGALSAPTPPGKHLTGRLALQPEADRMRRRLGQRFLAAGREVSVITGTLTIGAERQSISITRNQGDDGERVEVSIDGRPAALGWDHTTGASLGGSSASGSDRALIERLALDSVDEFIIGQLRGASYYMVARNVQPASAAGHEAYEGPVWDVVRVTEPQDSGVKPLSLSRHYFINSDTGLLERVVSDEQGQIVVAELSGWTTQAGEKVPTRIVWSQGKQVLMELNLSSFASSARQ